MKNRKSSDARPTATHLSGPSSEVGTGPVFGAATLANGTWAACSTSPRWVSMPAALEIAFCTAAKSAGGTDLSTSSATLSLLTAPAATLVCSTVLSTP
jgi:hypothetical protein